jgi:hypothetical protein
MKSLDKNIGETLQNIVEGKNFSDKDSKAQKTKVKLDKWDYIKLKIFCTTEETTSKIKISGEIFANDRPN